MAGVARRAWLQAVMSHRILSVEDAKLLHQRVYEVCYIDYAEDLWDPFLENVKASLAPIGLEIRTVTDEVTAENVMALVNTKGDESAQLATTYTSAELAYLKRIVSAIFTAPDEVYSIGSGEALNVAGRMKPPMKKRAAEDLLASLVGHGWLRLGRSGRYTLAPRAILELQSYLKAEHPDHLLTCHLCEDIVTIGHACPEEDCSCRMHLHCERLHRFGAKPRCPKCSSPWDPLPVGEESIGSGRRSRSASQSARDEEDEEPDEAGSEGVDELDVEGDAGARAGATPRRRRRATSASQTPGAATDGEGSASPESRRSAGKRAGLRRRRRGTSETCEGEEEDEDAARAEENVDGDLDQDEDEDEDAGARRRRRSKLARRSS